MKEPSNETYLAAELACLIRQPVLAARWATELCRLGRRYLKLSENLCNYPDPGADENGEGKWSRSRQRLWNKVLTIRDEINELSKVSGACRFDVDGGGLGLIFYTNPEGSPGETRTALR